MHVTWENRDLVVMQIGVSRLNTLAAIAGVDDSRGADRDGSAAHFLQARC